jgi:hypothetical protein
MKVQAEVHSCLVANQRVATSCPAAVEAVPIPTVEPAALLWKRKRTLSQWTPGWSPWSRTTSLR